MAQFIFEKLAKSMLLQGAKEVLKKIFEKKYDPKSQPAPEKDPSKVHPWRLCGAERHWVVTHPLTVPASEKNPSGKTIRDGHCANNPRRKKGVIVQDYMDRHEIDAIAESEFSKLKDRPKLGALTDFPGSDKFDPYIQGWTKYWNEVLKPETPLDPSVIKALVASESSYQLKPKVQSAGRAGKARGLIQLNDQAITALSNPKGEIKEHYVKITADETADANMSICAGIRWLHHKQKQATRDLGRKATWIESVEKYKGALNKSAEVKKRELRAFYKHYEELKK